jgi:hypothetical protein
MLNIFVGVFWLLTRLNLFTCTPKLVICKAVPGSSGWPEQSAWQTLNKTLGGALLSPFPPAIVCDKSRVLYNASSCSKLPTLAEWFNSSFHASNPVSVDFPNWQDDGCLPTKPDSNVPNICNLTPFPHYVVNATRATQVAAALKFAMQYNVRLSVKGTGHDLLGRQMLFSALSCTVLISNVGLRLLVYPSGPTTSAVSTFMRPSNPKVARIVLVTLL